MKPLIATIILVILMISLSGCVVISEHRHGGHSHHAVIVTDPPDLFIGWAHPRHRPVHHPGPWRPCPRFKHKHH